MKFRPKKILKWTGYTFLGLFLFLIALTWIIPFFFSDTIKSLIDKELQKQVNADVHFKANDFSLSFLRSFPNLSVGQENLSITGKGEFQGDTLMAFQSFRASVNVWSFLWGSEPQVTGIYLKKPRIFVKVKANGKANYDIMIPQIDTIKKEEKPTEFQIGIRWWEIQDGYLVYDDKVQKIYTKIDKLNHRGSGNFNQKIFDLTTFTSLDRLNVVTNGASMVENRLFEFDVTMNINNDEKKYTFKKNSIKINDFIFGFDGYVQLLKDSTTKLDVSYKAQENKFKNILSLIPAVFTKDFKELKTDGSLAFDGQIKGIVGKNKLPAFNLNLKVTDGMFQYPTLPTAVSNIQMNLMVNNKDGIIDNTSINLSKFHIDLGKNPIDMKAKIEGLTKINTDAKATAKIDLADLNKMFPMDGLVLKGNYSLDAYAKGVYNMLTGSLPSFSAGMNLLNGYAKSNKFPEALDNFNFVSHIKCPTGKLEDFELKVDDANFSLDKENFEVSALVQNLKDISYQLKAKGIIDLGKITKIFPLDKTKLSGRINADIENSAKVADILAGQYIKVKTSGFVKVAKLDYVHQEYLPLGFKITQSEAKFTPQSLKLEKFDGFLGKSDIHAQGDLTNYLGYTFKNETLKGILNFQSDVFDVNEWIPAGATPTNTTTSKPVTVPKKDNKNTPPPPLASAVVEVPKNIDFVLNSKIGKIEYQKTPIKNLIGTILVKNGIVSMQNVKFEFLGAGFVTNGSYNSADKYNPKYSFDLGIADLFLSNLYKAYSTETKLADNYGGKVNTLFKIAGDLDQQMMPKFDKSMNGNFSMAVAQALIKDPKIIDQIKNFIKIPEMAFKDFNVKAQIKDGKVNYTPFDIEMGKYKMSVSGNNSVDGSLDFRLSTQLPTTQLSTIGSLALSNILGKKIDANDIKANFAITGNYSSPKVNLVGADGKVIKPKEAIKEKVKEKIDEKKKEVVADIKKDASEKAEAILANAKEQADNIKAKAKEIATKIREEADINYQKALDEAYKNAYDNAPFAKGKAGDLAKKAADRIASPARNEAYKRATQVESEAENKANNVLSEGQKQADKLK